MSERKVTVNAGPGIGFLGLVFIVLLVLKLTGLATISWFWVFSPLMVVPAVLLAIGLVILTIFVVAKILDSLPGKRLKKKRF